jgi:hypothetical protein
MVILVIASSGRRLGLWPMIPTESAKRGLGGCSCMVEQQLWCAYDNLVLNMAG